MICRKKLASHGRNERGGANVISKLSADTLSALKEFYGERDARQKQFEDLKSKAEDDFEGKLSMEAFAEDWNASQFWVCWTSLFVHVQWGADMQKYSDETAIALARQLLDGATDETRIVVVSAPSVFIQLKDILVRDLHTYSSHTSITLIDAMYSDFRRAHQQAQTHSSRIRQPLRRLQRIRLLRLQPTARPTQRTAQFVRQDYL
jgi:EEF1A lysine methyltransferase 1